MMPVPHSTVAMQMQPQQQQQLQPQQQQLQLNRPALSPEGHQYSSADYYPRSPPSYQHSVMTPVATHPQAPMPQAPNSMMMQPPNPVNYVGGASSNSFMQTLRENSSLQNSIGAAGNPEARHYINASSDKIQQLGDVLNSNDASELQRDLDQARKMSLMKQDRAFYDTLYMREQSFMKYKRVFYEFVLNAYLEEFEELIDRRPGIFVWLQFVLSMAIFNGIDSVRSAAEQQSPHALRPTHANVPDIYRSIGARNKRARSTSAAAPDAKRFKSSSSSDTENLRDHKFFMTGLFKQNTAIFTIGTLMERIMPNDFAPTNGCWALKLVARHVQGIEPAPKYYGINVKPARPFVVAINVHNHTKGTSLNAAQMDESCRLAADMLRGIPDEHGLNVSIGKKQKVMLVPGGMMPSDTNVQSMNFTDNLLFGVITQFNGVATNLGTIDFRGFTNVYYVLVADKMSVADFEAAVEKDECEQTRRKELGYPPYQSPATLAAQTPAEDAEEFDAAESQAFF